MLTSGVRGGVRVTHFRLKKQLWRTGEMIHTAPRRLGSREFAAFPWAYRGIVQWLTREVHTLEFGVQISIPLFGMAWSIPAGPVVGRYRKIETGSTPSWKKACLNRLMEEL